MKIALASPHPPGGGKNSLGEINRIERSRVRLLFLDGLRGFAATYVMLFHAHWQIDWHFQPAALTGITAWISSLLDYGHAAVAIFIVLSGYSLMLPVARSGDFFIPGGIQKYLVRRGRRIFPPYYAALGLSLLLIACVSALGYPDGERWAVALPALRPDVIVSHLLMVHSFSPQWTSRIDPPMWSVGVEWWIYFFFPAVLLPLWRRVGMYGALGMITVLMVGLHWLPGQPVDFICPWYFALFGFGAAGAYVNFSPAAERERRWNWAWLCMASLVLCLLSFACTRGWVSSRPFIGDILLGLSFTVFVIWCGKESQGVKTVSIVLRVLESRVALWLGSLSYSLYLERVY